MNPRPPAGQVVMAASLSVEPRQLVTVETRLGRAFRLAVVGWLVVVEPVTLALALDRALPRLATLSPIDWLIVATRVGLVAAAIAVGRRLHAASRDAWRGVALWACASIAVTMLSQMYPALPTGRAPSEARIAAALAMTRDALLALAAAWRARRRRDAHDAASSISR